MTEEDSSEPEVLLEELRRQSNEREEQHQENIQILVALSIFAGYVTAFFNDLFNNFALNVATTALAAIVFAFLLYKLLVTSRVANGELVMSDRLDRLFSALYILSVVGFGFVVVLIVAAEQFDISIQNISSEAVVSALSFSIFPSLLAIFGYIGKKQKETLNRQEEILRERFPEALEKLENGGLLQSQRREVLIEQLEAILDKDSRRIPHWFWFGLLISVEPERPLSLSISDRSLLLSILERIDRRDKHDVYEEDDLRKIRSIIQQAEES